MGAAIVLLVSSAGAATGGMPDRVRCCGDFVARWYVGGRVVATWPFRYIPETNG